MVDKLDVSTAQASVESDREMLLELVDANVVGGRDSFNETLKGLMHSRMKEALLRWEGGDAWRRRRMQKGVGT